MSSGLGIGLGALGFGTSIYGAIKGAQANEDIENLINKQSAENEAYFSSRINRDYLDTNAAKGIVEHLRKRYQDQVRTIDSKGETTGATAESTIAAKSKANEDYNQGINRVAQKATDYQFANERDYRYSLSDEYNKRIGLESNKANNALNLAGAGANLMGTAAKVEGLE